MGILIHVLINIGMLCLGYSLSRNIWKGISMETVDVSKELIVLIRKVTNKRISKEDEKEIEKCISGWEKDLKEFK